MRFPILKSAEDIVSLVEEIGFLPFFRGEIEGFSIEECTPPELWWGGDVWGPWEWKGPIIRTAKCAYGKFYKGKAMYISKRFFPDFCNFRRDGYDFDSRMDEGIARGRDVPVMKELWREPVLLSKELKARVCASKEKRSGFDGILTRLQMMGYVNIADFVYERDKHGKEYGWGLAVYTTPEAFFGEEFREKVYVRTPEQSYANLHTYLSDLLPWAGEKQIDGILSL